MALRSLETGHTINSTRCKNWVCQALGRPRIGLTTKLESAEAGPGENGSAQPRHGQPRNWTRQNWTRNTKLDAPRPTRICVSNFAFSDPKSDPIFGIIGRVKTDTECDLKKIGRNPIFRQCVQFFILVSFSSIKNWTRALSKIGRTKKLDAGFKTRKLDAPFWA